MNLDDQQTTKIVKELSAWTAAEPRLASACSLTIESLKNRLERQRRIRQRLTIGLASSACAGLLLLVYFRPLNHIASSDQSVEFAASNTGDGSLVLLQTKMHTLETENMQLQLRLQRLSIELELLRRYEPPLALVEQYESARRQRAKEKVLDAWLAKNQ
jgi:hypothetical protein